MPSLRDLLYGQPKAAGNTLDLQKEYRDYAITAQESGEAPVTWAQFVEQRGYRLDRNGNAVQR